MKGRVVEPRGETSPLLFKNGFAPLTIFACLLIIDK
jgi:hypothetical protein